MSGTSQTSFTAPAGDTSRGPTASELRARARAAIEGFLEHYCDLPLVEEGFLSLAQGTTGRERFGALSEAAGFPGDPEGFTEALVSRLEGTSCDEPGPIEMNGLALPYHLLLRVMEAVLPGAGFVAVKKVRRLERLLNLRLAEEERDDLQRVLDLYPVRLSWHVIRQMRLSPHVSRQFRPFPGELDRDGQAHTWVGQFHRGILEQMYRNRVIFIMNMSCPVYCRFCFRKHKECRNQKAPTKEHVKQATAYLRECETVTEVVITGGEPLMNRATLQYAVQELAKIPHVRTLRLASRCISYYPEMFLRDDSFWLNYLVRVNLELDQRGKRLEVATHFIHPDEISIDSLHIVSHLVRHGIPVYVQTPLLAGCNETGREMLALFHRLRAAGAEMHYIFMPTSPIQGNKTFWSPISRGLETARWLRAHLSDRAMPHVTTATSIGKMDWNTSGWAVERDSSDRHRIWIRTPYNEEYFEPFAPILQWRGDVRSNAEGTLDAAFRAEAGDEELLAGARALTSSKEAHEHKLARTAEVTAASLDGLQASCLEDQRLLDVHIGPRPGPWLARPHRTRVEIDTALPDEGLDAALEYLRERPEVVEVVLSRRDDVLSAFSRTLEVVDRLREAPNVSAVRLRSLMLNRSPEVFSRAAVRRLASRNRLEATRPQRLELETWFLHRSEHRAEQERVVRELRLQGITAYANVPLLGHVNDNGADLLGISRRLRESGIEFCNVYVAGLPVQDRWNRDHPIEPSAVVDVATHVRRHGSGREVPRYLVRTRLGEVDFSIAPRIFVRDGEGGVRVRLLPHDRSFFREMAPRFRWPSGVTTDDEGHPLVPVAGLAVENQDFFL
jgi:KamA family protein